MTVEADVISGEKDKLLWIQPSESSAPSLNVSSLHGCVLCMPANVGALHLSSCTNSHVVLMGPVSGSVLIDSCKDVLIVFGGGAHQVRLNECRDMLLDFEVDSQTPPIIEKSQGIRFSGPSGLSGPSPTLTAINDFSWLRRTKSPNWEIVTTSVGAEKIAALKGKEGSEIRDLKEALPDYSFAF